MKNLKIEMHLLQNFPPSCLNRDDTNTPKTCEFGGVTRARVSSQCWKRAIREQFKEITPDLTGTRTKRLKSELITALVNKKIGTIETLDVPVTKFVTTFYAGMDKKRPEETNVLVFYSPAEFDCMLSILSEEALLSELRKETSAIKKNDIEKKLRLAKLSPDVALFARMLADAPVQNIDAACQVAHAISTHSVNLELDFFTAIDDLKDTTESDDAGAGMLGTVGYDSACYYRYALIDCVQLANNLNNSAEDIESTVHAFMTAFCEAIPIAKKNSFAHGNLPFFALFVVRRAGSPTSLVNAFAKPVNALNGNLLFDSANALAHQVSMFEKCYELYSDDENVKTFLSHMLDVDTDDLEGLPTKQNLAMKKAISDVVNAMKDYRDSEA